MLRTNCQLPTLAANCNCNCDCELRLLERELETGIGRKVRSWRGPSRAGGAGRGGGYKSYTPAQVVVHGVVPYVASIPFSILPPPRLRRSSSYNQPRSAQICRSHTIISNPTSYPTRS